MLNFESRTSITHAANSFKILPRLLHKWKKSQEKLEECDSKKRLLEGINILVN